MKTTGIERYVQVVRGPVLWVRFTELAACEHLTQRLPAERAFCLYHRSLIECHYTESIYLTAKLVYPPHLWCRHPHRIIIHTFPPLLHRRWKQRATPPTSSTHAIGVRSALGLMVLAVSPTMSVAARRGHKQMAKGTAYGDFSQIASP